MNFIYGLNKSGVSIIKLLEKKNTLFKIWDDNKKVRQKFEKFYNIKTFVKPLKGNLKIFENIYVTPGISIRQKKFNIQNSSKKIKRDLNIYIDNLENEKIIAITGTNGKSTTTKLIGEILKKKKIKTFIGGNIGEPLCNSFITKKKYKYHVIELSSFQLETVKNLNSKISIITNLSNDHTDRYNGISDYIKQKKNILTKKGFNLISIDDNYSNKIFNNIKNYNKISFSIFNDKADCFVNDNYIIDNYFSKNKINIKNISRDLQGNYNKQNILISYICSKILNIEDSIFLESIKKFKGLPFRSNIIFENKNLKIINNSKSTNLNSTINSIDNYNNIYLIVGGKAKEKNFEILSKFKKRIICIYLYGQSSNFIYNKLESKIKLKKFNKLNNAVKQIFIDLKKTKNKSIILFSPACSSYDQFINFEERGKFFTNLIKKEVII